MRRRPENETSRRKVKSFRKIREKMSHFRKHRNGEVMKRKGEASGERGEG